jgi:hypothetical protein
MLNYNSPFVEEPFPNFRWMTPVFQPNQPKLYCEFSLCASAHIKTKSIESYPSYQKKQTNKLINHSQSSHPSQAL